MSCISQFLNTNKFIHRNLAFHHTKTFNVICHSLSDGATRCGPFCVVYNVLEQISVDREVDVFTTTRQLQVRRPEFVSTLVSEVLARIGFFNSHIHLITIQGFYLSKVKDTRLGFFFMF